MENHVAVDEWVAMFRKIVKERGRVAGHHCFISL